MSQIDVKSLRGWTPLSIFKEITGSFSRPLILDIEFPGLVMRITSKYRDRYPGCPFRMESSVSGTVVTNTKRGRFLRSIFKNHCGRWKYCILCKKHDESPQGDTVVTLEHKNVMHKWRWVVLLKRSLLWWDCFPNQLIESQVVHRMVGNPFWVSNWTFLTYVF